MASVLNLKCRKIGENDYTTVDIAIDIAIGTEAFVIWISLNHWVSNEPLVNSAAE